MSATSLISQLPYPVLDIVTFPTRNPPVLEIVNCNAQKSPILEIVRPKLDIIGVNDDNVDLVEENAEGNVEEMKEEDKIGDSYFCYLLKSTTTTRTYVGYTKSVAKRLRAHNGFIQGGAKATRYGRPWILIGYVTGFPTSRAALQYEYKMHHPDTKRYNVPGRIQNMAELLIMDRWTSTAPQTNTLQLQIVWLSSTYPIPERRLPFCPPNCKEFIIRTLGDPPLELPPNLTPIPHIARIKPKRRPKKFKYVNGVRTGKGK